MSPERSDVWHCSAVSVQPQTTIDRTTVVKLIKRDKMVCVNSRPCAQQLGTLLIIKVAS